MTRTSTALALLFVLAFTARAQTRHQCFLLQPLDGGKAFVSDRTECALAKAPASTFKVPHALIALETGVVKDVDAVTKWDGTDYPYASWERDQTLESAIRVSAYWYFQRTAAAIGAKRMHAWLTKLHYARDTFERELTSFWIDGDLVVTPQEQLRFLRRMMRYELPVARKHVDAIRAALVLPPGKVTLAAGASDFSLQWPKLKAVRGKTGNTSVDGERVSWLIGTVEAGGREYVFVSRVRVKGSLPGTAGAEYAVSMLNAHPPSR